MSISRPRGTNDLLPGDSCKWQQIEELLHTICREFAYQELRTPIFEATELFSRGVGDTTDIVQKEMYTFEDRGGRSLTLRPENTAASARAYLENKMQSLSQPVKLYYIGPMFRYERPQAGRFRQFHQFGIEVFGSEQALTDGEIIFLAWEILSRLGIQEKNILLNSVGCPQCRPHHQKALQDYLQPYFEELCPLCQQRLERNPLRIMDCKNEHCQAIIADAPKIREYLCDDCREHFAEVQELLVAAEIPFVLDDNLVRGLDYYTRTAFEIVSGKLGSQSAVCGGGRYDGLMKDIGGPAIPGVGFALGLERLISLVEQENPHWYKENKTEVFISVQNQELNTKKTAFALCCLLRKLGWSTEMDLLARSLKSQFKQADKIKADYVLLIGGDELAENKAVLRKMSLGEQEIIPLEEVAAYFEKLK